MNTATLRAGARPFTERRRVRALLSCLAFAALPGHAATVTDGTNGLQWDACAWGQTDDGGACTGGATALTWTQALAAAQQANAAHYQGYTDWRVPNRTELESTVDIAAAAEGSGGRFWSSTSYQSDAARAWMVDFGDGASHPADKAATSTLRLVRAGSGAMPYELPARAAQSITWPDPVPASHDFVAGGTFEIDPLAVGNEPNSGNPIVYSSTSTDICAVTGTTVTMIAPGVCTLAADQAGNDDYFPLARVTRRVTIRAAPPPPPPPPPPPSPSSAPIEPVPGLSERWLVLLSALLGLAGVRYGPWSGRN